MTTQPWSYTKDTTSKELYKVVLVRAAQTTAQSGSMELPFSNGNTGSVESLSSGGSTDSGGDFFKIRVRIPELEVENCFCFRRDRTIWFAKLQLLKSLSKPLTDSLNFGFYLPPSHGKAGKFLEEERPFSDYPTDPANMPFLEFKYKRRVYKQIKLDIKEVRKYHNKANIKMFFECARSKNTDKIAKMTGKCMDPNIHEESTGETPLTVAASMKNSEEVIQALISGGAHLDYRARDGKTAFHKAVKSGNQSIIELLLSLGASPNYKDSRGLTALYYNVQHGGDPMIAELLLKDRATVNISDEQGWKEIHHACRYGRIQHLQLLIYYGADINCQNEAGNTPLHVSAAYNQESAARMVLFRGGNRSIKNKSSQTPFQVAIVSNNFSLGEMIKNYSEEDVVIQQEVPSYNNRRRCSSLTAVATGVLSRTVSEPFLPGQFLRNQGGNRMSIASSSSFTDDDSIPEEVSSPKRSGSVGSMGRSAAVARMVHRKIKDTKPGKLYICIKPYTAQEYGELTLMKGDYVKVHGIGEFNFWEGEVGNSRGWFPSDCVREVTGKEKAQTMRERKANFGESLTTQTKEGEPRVVFVERKKKGFGFILRGAKSPQGATSAFKPTKEFPALQYLEHVDKGSPADKAGLKRGDFVLEINGQDVSTAPHQYVVSLVINSPDTIVMKVVTLPNSKALVWLNEAKKNSLRKKPPQSQPSLTKMKAEKAQLEMQALDELDEAIAKAEMPADDQTESPFASIRKRPLSQKISPEHLTGIFHRQESAPSTSTPSQDDHRASLKKPVIPLAPSAFRFNTVARMSSTKTNLPSAASAVSPIDTVTMETQTQFDEDMYDKQKRRYSAGSDSALSSLRSSPASSYSYTTTLSNDSGVYTRADRTPSDITSPVDSSLSQVPPAPDYPAPSIPPAPSYPAPKHPNVRARSQSLHSLRSDSSMDERRMSSGQKRPGKPPPPVPRRDSSISEENLSRSISVETARPSSLDVPLYAEIQSSSVPETVNSDFSNAIAAAAAKREKLRKANSFDALESKTPLQLALAARELSLSGENQNRNQNAETASQGSPQLALNEAIARRKAHLDASKNPCENIESKIRKYKQADSAKGNSANQALLTAIAKRRSTIEKQMSEDSDSQSTSSEGSTKIESDKKDTTEHKHASSIKETDIAQAAAVMQSRLASKPPVKEPVNSFGGHKNVIKIIPRGESSKSTSPTSQSPRDKTVEGLTALQDTEASVQALKYNFEKNQKPDTYKHPLSPVKENEGDISVTTSPAMMGSLSSESRQPNGCSESDSSPQLHVPPLVDHRQERSFDSASVVSSMSSMSTMSSYSTLSTEPSSDIFEQDEDDGRTSTMKSSTSSSSSNSTLTLKNTKPSPKVLPKPKRVLDDNTPPSSSTSSETLDNERSLIINASPSSDVDNKQSMLSAWTEQGSNSNENDVQGWKTKPLVEWTSQDVGLWLTSLNLSEHRRSFEENEIAGEHLSALTKDDLQELGVVRMGHRLTISKAIKQL
ncbi:SH3 and multiple ankyrin repeat domains protein 3-like isoform X4 [Acanthaster planci]|uniref:SH3 and multiple ankyrin repeat domains protein 3-like isoform X4 n=1 Tax=Acanthaster planci TaxID=133434 RepID=A0A8B8A0H7_ACAPL|nr:SH3 and multiple ankyrin repeat domains protein 3-like isoform X4 [Acanthaster planci]XP_022111185.1 SH3 and multiple ankyrin repeat domains protein 3-like isoform X4 [Acanthaster planci]